VVRRRDGVAQVQHGAEGRREARRLMRGVQQDTGGWPLPSTSHALPAAGTRHPCRCR